jgi:DNA-binding transcriptional ArsR family regulator
MQTDRVDERKRMTEEWEEIGFVISSQYRVAVLRRLSEGPATPSKIAEDIDRSDSHTSRALHDLRDHGLVELLVPEERRKGRIYGITDDGQVIWNRIEAENLLE